MSCAPLTPFETYDQAIVAVHKLLEQHSQTKEELRHLAMVSHVSGHTNDLKMDMASEDRAHGRDVMKWAQRLSSLATPWPLDKIDQLFTPGPELQKKLDGLDQRAGRALSRSRLPNVWGVLSDAPTRNKLMRLLVEGLGVPPHRYFAASNITLLGQSAYTGNAAALKIILPACPPPACRLVTERHHLSEKVDADSWLVGSTLLHRVVDQNAGLIDDKDNAKRVSQLKKVLDLLIKHDPDCLLVRNQTGHLPEEMAPASWVGEWVGHQRRHYQARVRRQQLSGLSGDIRSARAPAKGPSTSRL